MNIIAAVRERQGGNERMSLSAHHLRGRELSAEGIYYRRFRIAKNRALLMEPK
jgi:hypothetical protein